MKLSATVNLNALLDHEELSFLELHFVRFDMETITKEELDMVQCDRDERLIPMGIIRKMDEWEIDEIIVKDDESK